jgi:hypothetical protein
MATRTKAETQKLLEQQLEAERIERLEALEHERLLFAGELDEPDAYAKIRAYCSTVGTEDSLGIYRQLPQQKELFICKIEADEFDPETIKARFGGGTFIIKAYDVNNKIRLKQFISIEGDPIIESNKPVSSVAAPAPTSDLTSLLQVMQQGFEKMLSAMTSQPKPKSTLEFVQEITAMRELFAPAAPAVSAADQFMNGIKMGADLAAMNGGGGDNAWALEAMRTFGRPIMEAVVAGKTKPALSPAHRTLPAPGAAKVEQPAASTQEENPVNLILKGYIAILGNAAAQNADVADYADEVLDTLTPAQLPEVEAILRADDWQAQLARHSRAVNDYPVWFAALRNQIIEFIDADRADAAQAALTAVGVGASVTGHENDHTGATTNKDNPGGPA